MSGAQGAQSIGVEMFCRSGEAAGSFFAIAFEGRGIVHAHQRVGGTGPITVGLEKLGAQIHHVPEVRTVGPCSHEFAAESQRLVWRSGAAGRAGGDQAHMIHMSIALVVV